MKWRNELPQWVMPAIIIVLVLSLAFVAVKSPRGYDNGRAAMEGLTVSGTGEVSTMPDMATVSLQVLTQADDAAQAQQENAQRMADVQQALRDAGVMNLETTGFNVYPLYDYDEGREITGYEARHIVSFETTDLTAVGEYIDLAIDAGANEVDRVSFDLSEQNKKDLYQQALEEASSEAQSKAHSVAAATGARLGKLIRISESNIYHVAVERYALDIAEAATTPIAPGDVDVRASVTLVYAIK